MAPKRQRDIRDMFGHPKISRVASVNNGPLQSGNTESSPSSQSLLPSLSSASSSSSDVCDPGQGRGGNELDKIAQKSAKTQGFPVICYDANKKKLSEHASTHAAARELGLDQAGISQAARTGVKCQGRYFAYDKSKTKDLPGEIWKPLPRKVPPHLIARRKRNDWKPGKEWRNVRISNKGRVKRLRGVPTYGTKTPKGYRYKTIDSMSWNMHNLVCLAHGKKIKPGYEVDHCPDPTKDNNCIENLVPKCAKKHRRETQTRNLTSHIQRRALKVSRYVLCLSSTKHPELVNQTKTTAEFAALIDAKQQRITEVAWKNSRYIKTSKLPSLIVDTCVFVQADCPLYENEEIREGQIKIDGQLHPFKVTTLGRIWREKSSKFLQVDNVEFLPDKYIQVTHLIALAKDGLTEIPCEPNGRPMTVDHINGRDHAFPHRFDNLRWATLATQMANRVCQ